MQSWEWVASVLRIQQSPEFWCYRIHLSLLLPTSRSLSSSKNSNEMVSDKTQQLWSFGRSWTGRKTVSHILRAFYEIWTLFVMPEIRMSLVLNFLRKASWSSAAELFKYAEQLYFVSAWIIQKLDKFEHVISIKGIISRETYQEKISKFFVWNNTWSFGSQTVDTFGSCVAE